MNTALHSIQEQMRTTEARFSLCLEKDGTLSRESGFDRSRLDLTVRNGRIESGVLIDEHGDKRTELRVTERSQHKLEIVMEDAHGMIRMILKPSADETRYMVSMNHPANNYLLNMN